MICYFNYYIFTKRLLLILKNSLLFGCKNQNFSACNNIKIQTTNGLPDLNRNCVTFFVYQNRKQSADKSKK